MDFITKLPKTTRRNNYIAVIVYRLSKHCVLKAIVKGEDGISTKETIKIVYLIIRR